VTADSGNRPKSVTFDRNDWSRSAETSGHVAPEPPVTFGRNTHPRAYGLLSAKSFCGMQVNNRRDSGASFPFRASVLRTQLD
jgi:hypothetical protein